MRKDAIGKELNKYIREADNVAKVVQILHGGSNDKEELASLGCNICRFDHIDTQLIDRALHYKRYCSKCNQTSLQSLVREVGYRPETDRPFHNAGNDAFYTMIVFHRLATIQSNLRSWR